MSRIRGSTGRSAGRVSNSNAERGKAVGSTRASERGQTVSGTRNQGVARRDSTVEPVSDVTVQKEAGANTSRTRGHDEIRDDEDDGEDPGRRVRRRVEEEEARKGRGSKKSSKQRPKRGKTAGTGEMHESNTGADVVDINALHDSLNAADKAALQELLLKAQKKKKMGSTVKKSRPSNRPGDIEDDNPDDSEDERDDNESEEKIIDVESENEAQEKEQDEDGATFTPMGVDGQSDDEQEVPINAPVPMLDQQQSRTPISSASSQGPPEVCTDRDDLRSADHNSNESTERHVVEPLRQCADPSSAQVSTTEQLELSVIMSFMRTMKAEVMASVNEVTKSTMQKVKAQGNILNSLREDMEDFSSILTATSAIIFNRQLGLMPKSKQLQKHLCILPALFNERLIMVVMSRCYLGFYDNEISAMYRGVNIPVVTDFETLGRRFLQLMFFAKQRNETKREKYATDLGKTYSKLIHGVLLSVIMAQQDNAFNTFKRDKETNHQSLSSIERSFHADRGDDNNSKIQQPKWLAPNFICREHCDEAAARIEKRTKDDRTDNGVELSTDGSLSNSSIEDGAKKPSRNQQNRMKQQKGTEISKSDVALEAAGMVYRLITNILHRCRDTAKLQLFHDLSYLFTGWGNGRGTSAIDQKSLTMKWKQIASRDVDYVETVSYTRQAKIQDRYNMNKFEFEDINSDNVKVLRHFMRDHPEMCLVVEQDVSLAGRIKRITCHIHITEFVCKLIAAFSVINSNSSSVQAMCIDRSALKVAAVISIAIRNIIDRTLKDVDYDGASRWANMKTGKTKSATSKQQIDETSADGYIFPEIDGISMDTLQPSNSGQKDTLWPMCLHLKESEYHMKHEGLEGIAGRQRQDGETNEQSCTGRRIEADGSNAVFRFA